MSRGPLHHQGRLVTPRTSGFKHKNLLKCPCRHEAQSISRSIIRLQGRAPGVDFHHCLAVRIRLSVRCCQCHCGRRHVFDLRRAHSGRIAAISANATSSIVQFPGYVTSTLAYKTELLKRWRSAVALTIISAVGGLAGALILLALDNPSFRAMVPWLLAAATAIFAAGPLLKPKASQERSGTSPICHRPVSDGHLWRLLWRGHGHYDAGRAGPDHRRKLPPPECAEKPAGHGDCRRCHYRFRRRRRRGLGASHHHDSGRCSGWLCRCVGWRDGCRKPSCACW